MARVTTRDRRWLKFDPEDRSFWVDLTRKGRGRLKKKIMDPIGVRDLTKARAVELGDHMIAEWLRASAAEECPRNFAEGWARVRQMDLTEKRASTIAKNDLVYRLHLEAEFGDLPLSAVTEERWAAHVSQRLAKNPKKRSFEENKVLTKVMNWAHRRGYVPDKRTFRDPVPKERRGQVIPRVAFQNLLEEANDEIKLIVRLGWECGMRRKEVLALRFDQIRDGVIYLDVAGTKTKTARKVPIPPDLMASIEARKTGSCFVFPMRGDLSRHKTTITKTWGRLRQRAKVDPSFRFHDSRHSFLSRKLLGERKNPLAVCAYAGLSIKTAQKVYLHANLDDLREVIN